MGLWQKLRAALGARPSRAPASRVASTSTAEPKTSSDGAPTAKARAAAGFASVAAREPTPEEQFADLALGLAQAQPFVVRAEPHPTKPFTLRVTLEDGPEGAELYLGNLFVEMRELPPNERRARLEGLLAALEPHDPIGWDEARSMLVPLLRSTVYAAGAGRAVASRPFLPFLVEAIGLDHEQTTQVLTMQTLDDWGVSLDAACSQAHDVLAHHMDDRDVETWDPEASYPTFSIDRDDSYESSRLLVPGFLASFRGRVRGNPIAIVPHRNLLVVSGDADPDAVRRLLDTAEREYRASPRSLSPDLYTVDADGRVVPWDPPAEHPHRRIARRNRLLLAGTEYAQQKDQLEQQLADRDDVFVASYSIVMPDGDDLPFSYSVLPEGVPTLLPRTDVLVFAGGSSGASDVQHLFVRFEDAERILGEGFFTLEAAIDPPRLRAPRWPDTVALARLAQAALQFSRAPGAAGT